MEDQLHIYKTEFPLYPMIIPAKFGSIWLSNFAGEELNVKMLMTTRMILQCTRNDSCEATKIPQLFQLLFNKL